MPRDAALIDMPLLSAGILMYRRAASGFEVLLVHPGGPFWGRKDDGAWSIPKGLIEPGEDAEFGARREFAEETGFPARGPLTDLGMFKQPGGKTVHAWALEGDLDPQKLNSNTFALEWPPRSGRTQQFPEADRAAWFAPQRALQKATKGQRAIIEKFLTLMASRGETK